MKFYLRLAFGEEQRSLIQTLELQTALLLEQLAGSKKKEEKKSH